MDVFARRHIGPNADERQEMLNKIGVSSMEELIDKTVPSHIRLKKELDITPAMSEYEYLAHINQLGAKNKVYKSFIGLGYSETIVPSVILRNVLENPGWYTAYTPYQAEISQGRLEALLNFQTMVMDLTGMEMANASLLDEGTSAAEAMMMLFNARSREDKKAEKNRFFVSNTLYPQTIDVLKGRAANIGIELVIDAPENFKADDKTYGVIVQNPDTFGKIIDLAVFIKTAQEAGIKTVVAADIMSLVLLEAPGKLGADVVVGNTQRFGVPMGFGGPHAAYFACKEEYKRNLPGRIIGVSIDADGNTAYRMALQMREQHIKRDKATSNICTAQALLATMAGMYAVYHGAEGLRAIATDIHTKAATIAEQLTQLGQTVVYNDYFDTVTIKVNGTTTEAVKAAAEQNEINFRIIDGETLSISVGEGVTQDILNKVVASFATALGKNATSFAVSNKITIKDAFLRNDEILTHSNFKKHHSESKMMRYLKRLENKDLSLVHSMISLGSCTMKLNAASELMPITNPNFANMHPFCPREQAQGYLEMIQELDKDLSEITGFAGMSFQPNSGAQGEYAGLMVIKAYHESRGDFNRKIMIIPASAHGTNPASATVAGFDVVVTKTDKDGSIDVAALKEVAEKHKENLAGIMITYPSTHGVYEETIVDITDIIHANGGQVYMDGANMNAQVGLTNPGNIGADVCHLNLHKTFAIPHGGGGPGVGPIGVASHLKPFLPGNIVSPTGGEKAIHAVSSAPFGSALILLISYGYIKMLGADGLRASTENAILNANYIVASLKGYYPVLYTGENGMVAHEMIADCRDFKRISGVDVGDVAKRLMDYGFHAPTVSFPVHETLMIEPTESEDKEELDRFIEAMISIKKEIDEVAEGKYSQEDNVLKNAPHTADCIINQEWNHSYSPKKAAYPVAYLKEYKYWVPVRRVDNAYGDRNLICSCPAVEEYMTEA